MARICTFCGAGLREGDVYCGKCGSLAAGMTPPANAWSRISAELDASPKKKKKRGCLTALVIFLVIAALLAGVFYFAVVRRLGKGIKDSFDLDLRAGTNAASTFAPESAAADQY